MAKRNRKRYLFTSKVAKECQLISTLSRRARKEEFLSSTQESEPVGPRYNLRHSRSSTNNDSNLPDSCDSAPSPPSPQSTSTSLSIQFTSMKLKQTNRGCNSSSEEGEASDSINHISSSPCSFPDGFFPYFSSLYPSSASVPSSTPSSVPSSASSSFSSQNDDSISNEIIPHFQTIYDDSSPFCINNDNDYMDDHSTIGSSSMTNPSPSSSTQSFVDLDDNDFASIHSQKLPQQALTPLSMAQLARRRTNNCSPSSSPSLDSLSLSSTMPSSSEHAPHADYSQSYVNNTTHDDIYHQQLHKTWFFAPVHHHNHNSSHNPQTQQFQTTTEAQTVVTNNNNHNNYHPIDTNNSWLSNLTIPQNPLELLEQSDDIVNNPDLFSPISPMDFSLGLVDSSNPQHKFDNLFSTSFSSSCPSTIHAKIQDPSQSHTMGPTDVFDTAATTASSPSSLSLSLSLSLSTNLQPTHLFDTEITSPFALFSTDLFNASMAPTTTNPNNIFGHNAVNTPTIMDTPDTNKLFLSLHKPLFASPVFGFTNSNSDSNFALQSLLEDI